MRKLHIGLAVFLVFAGSLFAQSDIIKITLQAQNPIYDSKFLTGDVVTNEITTKGQTDLISKTTKSKGGKEEESQVQVIDKLSFGSTALLGGNMLAYALPLGYTIPLGLAQTNNISFGVTLPFIFQRKISYSGKDASSSGLGDVMLNTSLGVRLDGRWFGTLHFGVKLPSGDKNASDDGYLVPLGTGSTDYFIGLSATAASVGAFDMNVNAFYRIGGTTNRLYEAIDAEHDITKVTEENVKSGAMMGASITAAYPLGDVTLFATPSFLHLNDGEIESIVTIGGGTPETTTRVNPTKNNVFDISLGAAYPIEVNFLGLTNGAVLYSAFRIPLNGKNDFSFSFNVNFSFKKLL